MNTLVGGIGLVFFGALMLLLRRWSSEQSGFLRGLANRIGLPRVSEGRFLAFTTVNGIVLVLVGLVVVGIGVALLLTQ